VSVFRRVGAGVVTAAAAAVVFLASGPATADPAGALSVRLTALRNARGRVGCALYSSERGFPTDSTAAVQRIWCPIVGSEATCRFAPAPAGTYAVACFHDENGNGRCDTGLFGIPTEGTVVSNRAKGFLGPPKFADAKFAFPGNDAEIRLPMGY
jgi:uncharacterized protein (DUF2141 family)